MYALIITLTLIAGIIIGSVATLAALAAIERRTLSRPGARLSIAARLIDDQAASRKAVRHA